MKHPRLFSILAVSALLVSAPKTWAAGRAPYSGIQLIQQANIENIQGDRTSIGPGGNALRVNNGLGNNVGSPNQPGPDGVAYNKNTDGTVNVVSLAGTITVDLGGGKTVTIDPGKGTVLDPKTGQPIKDGEGKEVRSLSAMLQTNSADRAALVKALSDSVQRHAQQVVSNPDAAQTKELVTETAFMMKTLAGIVQPAELNTIMQTAVATLTTTNTVSGGTSTNTVVSALIEAAKQGGGDQTSLITAANTGAQSNGKGFTSENLQSATVVNQVLTTTPVNVDLVSPNGE